MAHLSCWSFGVKPNMCLQAISSATTWAKPYFLHPMVQASGCLWDVAQPGLGWVVCLGNFTCIFDTPSSRNTSTVSIQSPQYTPLNTTPSNLPIHSCAFTICPNHYNLPFLPVAGLTSATPRHHTPGLALATPLLWIFCAAGDRWWTCSFSCGWLWIVWGG